MIEYKTHRGHPVTLDGFRNRVDIIIPFHGQYNKVTHLLESIWHHTHSNVYQICLVDDCSPNTDYSGHFLNSVPGLNLKCIRTESQLGFGGAMRKGFESTENPWVVFMNSDCLVEHAGWLKNLGKTLLKHKNEQVVMVAPLTNNPMSGDPRQKANKEDMVDGYDVILDLDKDPEAYLSMHCFMVHRDLFKKVGGFIKEYPYGLYEDTEFAYRLKKNGYKQAIACSSWVYHEGEATLKFICRKNSNLVKIMKEDNAVRCQNDIKALYS